MNFMKGDALLLNADIFPFVFVEESVSTIN